MRALANLIPNKKMVGGRGGRGDQSKTQPRNTLLGETRKTIGQLHPPRGCVCLDDLLQTPGWRRAETTRQL